MPDWLAVILLGAIEGLTEFLPVSSTGHLILAQQWLRPRSELFNIVIQCGAVLAVLVVFARRAGDLAFSWRKPATRDYLLKLALAYVLTGAGGLAMKQLGLRLSDDPMPVALATLIGGFLILWVERWLRHRPLSDQVTWGVACAAGLAQLLAAAFPGTSRSGASILAALALGLNRPAATEFSFLLGIPTLLTAGAYEVYSAFRHQEAGGEDWSMVGLGSLAAAITAFAVVKWLLRFVQSHTFTLFGWYRIVLGTLILLGMFWNRT